MMPDNESQWGRDETQMLLSFIVHTNEKIMFVPGQHKKLEINLSARGKATRTTTLLQLTWEILGKFLTVLKISLAGISCEVSLKTVYYNSTATRTANNFPHLLYV